MIVLIFVININNNINVIFVVKIVVDADSTLAERLVFPDKSGPFYDCVACCGAENELLQAIQAAGITFPTTLTEGVLLYCLALPYTLHCHAVPDLHMAVPCPAMPCLALAYTWPCPVVPCRAMQCLGSHTILFKKIY